MFVEVESTDMVVGVKYAILVRHDVWTYRTGIFKCHLDGEQTFHYMKEHSGIDIENIDTYSTLRNMQNMDKHISYYAFVPKEHNP